MTRKSQRGFTLIELLVGLTLLGLIVVAVTGGLRVGLTGTERVTERASVLDEMRGTSAFLRERLEAARPIRWLSDDATQLAFEGGPQRLSFVTDMPPFPGIGGLYKLTIARHGGGLALFYELTEGVAPGFATDAVPAEVLADDLTSFRIDYYGAQRGERDARWHEAWEGGAALPELLRVRIATRRAGAWPELVVAPRLGDQPR